MNPRNQRPCGESVGRFSTLTCSAYAGFCGEMETIERDQSWSARVAETTLQLQQGALELTARASKWTVFAQRWTTFA